MYRKPQFVSSHADLGIEIWARFDTRAEYYELYEGSSCDACIGEADSMHGARQFAREYFDELCAE